MFRATRGGGIMESIIEELYYGNITPVIGTSSRAAHRRLCHRLRLAQSVRVTDSHKADGAGAIEEKPIKKGRFCGYIQ